MKEGTKLVLTNQFVDPQFKENAAFQSFLINLLFRLGTSINTSTNKTQLLTAYKLQRECSRRLPITEEKQKVSK